MIGMMGFRVGNPQGLLRYFRVPYYSGFEVVPDEIQRKGADQLIAAYPDIISYDTTLLSTDDETTQRLAEQGFTDIITLTGYTESSPYRVYWGDNYIEAHLGAAGTDGIHIVYHDVINHETFNMSPSSITPKTAVSFPASVRTDTTTYYSVGWRFFDYNQVLYVFESYYECGQFGADTRLRDFFWGTYPDEDPFVPGEIITGPQGGGGSRTRTGTNIPHANLPTISALDAGFITLFAPTAAELKNLARFMWVNPLFDITAWKKIFADPMDAILGLSIVPVSLAGGGSQYVTVGNITTDVSMTLASGQYVQVDCGSLAVPEFWGAYLDYDPYTKLEIYLPYCGTHALSADDCVGKTMHLYYNIDVLSGACAAQIEVNGTTLYTFLGQCSASIPITGGDWTNMINGVLSAAVSIGSLVASGGATAPTAVPALAATAVNSMKPNIEKSGAMGGTGGMLAVQTPYLILTTPVQALPKDQNKYTGYPSFITALLGDLHGYTEVEVIHLENISCTGDEQREIEDILKGGVIF